MIFSQADIERFWAKVAKEGECWTWSGCKDKDGYGFFRHCGKNLKAHRVSAILSGACVTGRLVCHRCDNPGCVRPDHLFVGSNSDNQRDAAKKDRSPAQKLTVSKVREIRRRYSGGETQVALAAEYGVSIWAVQSLIVRRKWAYVD